MITNVLKNKLPPHSNKAVLVYPVTLLKHVEASLPVFLPVGLCVAVTWCVCVCVCPGYIRTAVSQSCHRNPGTTSGQQIKQGEGGGVGGEGELRV